MPQTAGNLRWFRHTRKAQKQMIVTARKGPEKATCTYSGPPIPRHSRAANSTGGGELALQPQVTDDGLPICLYVSPDMSVPVSDLLL